MIPRPLRPWLGGLIVLMWTAAAVSVAVERLW